MNHAQFWGGGGAAPYEIGNSLRFRGSSYLTRTSGSSGGQTFTLSFWSKKTGLANYNYPVFMGGNTTNNYAYISYNNGQYLTFSNRENGNGNFSSQPDASYRDTGAWYHHVQVIDFTNPTQADRIRVFTNGIRISNFNFINLPTNTTSILQMFRSGENIRIGCISYNTSNIFDGYFAEFHCVYGSALDSDQFGEFDDNGVWRPIEYTGSHGTEGFYLDFSDPANIGADRSGNGNNFSPTGFSTSGTGTDVMSDTPTTNYATLNPLTGFRPNGATGRTYSDGNLVEYTPNQSGKEHPLITTTQFVRSADGGVYQFEDTVTNSNAWITFNPWLETENAYGSGNAAFFDFYNYSGYGTVSVNTGYGATGTVQEQGIALSASDVVTTVVDFDNNTVAFYVNGTRNGYITGCNFSNWDIWSPGFAIATGGATATTHTTNFGQQPFQYTPVSGAKPWSTAELPAPDIKNPGDHFNVVTYTGNGSTQSITGVGFQPDFVWVKKYNSSSGHHTLTDAVRGANKQLWSNRTADEQTSSLFLTSFDSDGFSVGDSSVGFGNVNTNNDSFAAFCWKAGNGTSSNTSGTITSTVSANPTAGFSIVSYTGNGQNSQTVGHGLGVAPRMCIGKSRSSNSWFIRHESLGSNLNLNFNASGTVTPGGGGLIGNLTSSTTISLPGGSNAGSGNMNASGTNYIMYCFSEVEGYSKFGSYIGNSSTDGPFVYFGFRPAWVMVRKVSGNSWDIRDSARDPYNPADHYMFADQLAVGNDNLIDLLSNGFKVRTTSSTWNTSGSEYIYMAFAENSFGGDGVSPATAR